MNKDISLELVVDEIRDLLSLTQCEIKREVEVLYDNAYEPSSETFVVFLESVHRKTDLYIKLNEKLKENGEEQ